MSEHRHSRVYELFLAAVDMPVSERSRYLDSACGSDTSLRDELNDLIGRDDDPGVVDVPIADGSDVCVSEWRAPEVDRIGRYEVLGELGRGGMGIVYRARQSNPDREVALKVVRESLFAPGLRRRLEYEAQVLGRLQHPCIAQIYEAGTADIESTPVSFFAMELVDGRTIIDHAQSHGLGVDARLRLIIDVCKGVHYAHQKGVVHRDIKSANILVTASGDPKVLDFGVARIVDTDVTTLQTQAGQLLGTIAYMSPEQLSGDPGEIDTRTDVYSLGVLLHELLAGSLPYDVTGKSVPEVARIVQTTPPRRLRSVDPAFGSDVETIVLKALEKEKEQRFASVSDLAGDLERYLRKQPIIARPATVRYQLRKFAQRNKALTGVTVLATALVLVTLAVISFALVQSNRHRADLVSANKAVAQEAEKADAVNAFLGRMLQSTDPMGEVRDGGASMTVLELLDREVDAIGVNFAGLPAAEAAVRTTIGRSYSSLGRYSEAEEQLRQAFDLHLVTSEGKPEEITRARRDLASVVARLGRLDEAAALFAQVLHEHESRGEVDTLDYAYTASRYGWMLSSQKKDYVEGERWVRASIEIFKQHDPAHDRTVFLQLARCTNNLAYSLNRQGKADEAEPLYREAMAMFRAEYGDDHATIGLTANNLARIKYRRGDVGGAAADWRDAIEVLEKHLGLDHADVGTLHNNIASAYYDLALSGERDYSSAIHHYGRATEIYGNAYGATSRPHLAALQLLCEVLGHGERYAEAAVGYRDLERYWNERDPADERCLMAAFWGSSSRARSGEEDAGVAGMASALERIQESFPASRRVQAFIRELVRFGREMERPSLVDRYAPRLSRDDEQSAALLDELGTLAVPVSPVAP